MIDLCYQTLALADIDRTKYAAKIAKNAERILSLQRPSGQWSMRFEPKQPEVEFQTGHALWALHAAGIPADHPQVAKAIRYLLRSAAAVRRLDGPAAVVREFPHAVPRNADGGAGAQLLLSRAAASKGMGHAQRRRSSSHDPAELLRDLDNIWDRLPARPAGPGEARGSVQRRADPAAGRGSARTGGCACDAWMLLAKLLGDPSKLVQRTAAWAMRQMYSRHEDSHGRV